MATASSLMVNVVAMLLHLLILLPTFLLLPSHGHADTGEEVMTHLHFFFHDTVSGRNTTAVAVTAPQKQAPSFLGLLNVMDDPLTEGPEAASRLLGRAQGFYLAAALDELAFLQAMNLVFTAGEYAGSTLSVLGRNAPFHEVREMPVVGGSGRFRFARGYVLARTHWVDLRSGNAIVEYTVHVLHQFTDE